MLLLQQLIGFSLFFLAYGDDCPIFFSPPEVMVEYEAQFSVNCTTSMTDDFGLSWKGYNDTENTNWIDKSVDIVKDWEMQLTCYIHSNETQCSQNLPVIIYKTPDNVSIITVNHIGPMMEGNQYELQCDVLNAAPAQFLTVKWYKGSTLVDQTNFTDTTKTPVNKTVTLLIRPNRADDGAQYSCEAELKLGAEGPQPPPSVTSDPFNITVNYTGCPLQFNPQRVVVEYGGSVSVNCSTFVPHEVMGWEASEGDPGRTDQGNLVTWNVSNLTEWGIIPSCFIIYETPCDVSLPLTIYKTPDRVSIITVNHNGPMMEGNQYELQCDVLNAAPAQFLTVKWYKGSTLVDQTNFINTTKTPVNKTVTLLIHPNRADDGAQYSCEAELKLGEEGPQPPPSVTSDPLNITVYYKPQINLCKDWSPTTGTSLVLYPDLNSFKGNPPPKFSWRRKSSLINASVLLNTNDSDRYEITASNELGNATCIINITVEYPPELNCNESYEVKEKTPLKHSCVAKGLPKPDLSLYKNGTIIQLPYYPTRNDGGWYQLTASNRHGTVNSTFFLNILYAPVFHASQEKFSVEENSNIILECNSTGNPEPDMWWSFINKNISTGRRHITLNIERATSATAGVYTCSATNEYGRNDKNFVVEIRVTSNPVDTGCPLQFNPQRVVVEYGGSASVTCSTSVPHEKMGWEASEGDAGDTDEGNLVTWNVSNLTEWGIKPSCFIIYETQCDVSLPLTIYKTPDRVSIITVNHNGPMMEGNQYELQCDVLNAAPAQFLTVKWYKGSTLVDQTNFSDTIKTPVNKTVTLLIHPNRADDGAQYSCEAELKLGEEGPQTQPKVTSDPLKITVYYAPVFHASQEKFSVEENSNIILKCNSTGNPEPDMWWSFNNKNISTGRRHITLNIERATSATAGVYTCSATNEYGRNDKNFIVEIRGNSTNYTAIFVPLAVALLILIIVFFIYVWKRKQSSGRYDVQSVEIGLLSNGGES